jgi:GDP-6-deoxy-D-talose 4-dehydrogenase
VRILVSGINGFVGSYLKNILEERGHEIFGIDIRNDDKAVFSIDLLDLKALSETVLSINPDAVIHLAGIAQVDFKNPNIIYNVNVIGTANLLTACAGLSNPVKFLFISSSQVYGHVPENKLPVDESFPVCPVNHYGASKAACEDIVRAFSYEIGIEFVIARPFNHTGKGQTSNFVIPKIVEAFKNRNSSIELGNTDTVRDFLDVRDVVRAYADIIENFKNGEVYNIASGRGIKISEVIEKLEELTSHKITIMHKEYLQRKSEIMTVIGNADKIYSSLLFKPRYNLIDTLKDMLL